MGEKNCEGCINLTRHKKQAPKVICNFKTTILKAALLILFVIFFSFRCFSQKTEIVDGDTVTTEIVIWDDYKFNSTSNYNPLCIDSMGATITLTRYIGENFHYPNDCVSRFIDSKMFFTIVVDTSGKLESVAEERSFCKGINDQLFGIIGGLQKVLYKKGYQQFTVEIKVKIMAGPKKSEPPLEYNPIQNTN
jgi:hypothetical protein